MARSKLSVPYASLTGSWAVLDRTSDGRAAVGLRDDERAGVAIAYPYAERRDGGDGVLKVAAVRNCEQGFVLLCASFVTLEAVPEGVRSVDDGRTIPYDRYDDLSDREVGTLLDGGTLILVDVGSEQWYPGALQLFDDPAAARSVWLESFPRLEKRLGAVERIVTGHGLGSMVDLAGPAAGGSRS